MNRPQLNRKRAFECENAIEKRCRCRCGGLLHGARRIQKIDDLDRLAKNDPHHVPKPIDTGLRAIVKITNAPPRRIGDRRFVAHLACGHQLVIPGSKLGPNRSRAHCEKCAPQQVMVARQRRAEGMDKTLMEFFAKHDRPKRYKPSRFPSGLWHVVLSDEEDVPVSPGVSTRFQAAELARILNRAGKKS